MPIAVYAVKEEFRENAHQPLTGAAADALYNSLLDRASRLLDLACELEPGYFGATSGTATDRDVYGEGGEFLKLPPYVAGSITGIVLPDGYEEIVADDYYEESGYLVRKFGSSRLSLQHAGGWLPQFPIGPFNLTVNSFRSSLGSAYGWPDRQTITVTAKWGWEAVPADVKQSVLEIAYRLWRGSDAAHLKVAALEAETVKDLMPASADLVVERYRERKVMAFA